MTILRSRVLFCFLLLALVFAAQSFADDDYIPYLPESFGPRPGPASNLCSVENFNSLLDPSSSFTNMLQETDAMTARSFMKRSVVFTSDQVGYKFYIHDINGNVLNNNGDVNGRLVYVKTTNGGLSWGSKNIIDSDDSGTYNGIYSKRVGVPMIWYDRWTPGDNGNLIHIFYTKYAGTSSLLTTPFNSTGDYFSYYYRTLDTTTGALSGATRILNEGESFTTASRVSLTKSSDGTLYFGMINGRVPNPYTNSSSYYRTVDTSFVRKCPNNCNTASNWRYAGFFAPEQGINKTLEESGFPLLPAVPSGTRSYNVLQLLPLSDGKILAVTEQRATNTTYSKDYLSTSYNPTTNQWSTEAIFMGQTTDNITLNPQGPHIIDYEGRYTIDEDSFDAFLLAYAKASTNSFDRTYNLTILHIKDGALHQKYTVARDDLPIRDADIAIDQNTKNIYLARIVHVQTYDIYIKKILLKIISPEILNASISDSECNIASSPDVVVASDSDYEYLNFNFASNERIFLQWAKDDGDSPWRLDSSPTGFQNNISFNALPDDIYGAIIEDLIPQ